MAGVWSRALCEHLPALAVGRQEVSETLSEANGALSCPGQSALSVVKMVIAAGPSTEGRV